MSNLMRYIPKEYKKEVLKIYKGEKFWNEYSSRYNTPIIVEWIDGKISEYQNAGYMQFVLKEIGRN